MSVHLVLAAVIKGQMCEDDYFKKSDVSVFEYTVL